MTFTRAAYVAKALTYDGLNDGTGYPGPSNVFEVTLGRPQEFWCGDFLAAISVMLGDPFPSMEVPGCPGFPGVPAGWSWGQSHGIVKDSWAALPGDLVILTWDGSTPDHVETVTRYENGALWTIGGDSGPTTVPGNPFTGQGGVHQHIWSAPAGIGNALILGVLDLGGIVDLAPDNPAPTQPPEEAPTVNPPELINGQASRWVPVLQEMLHQLGFYSGLEERHFGPITLADLNKFRASVHLDGANTCGADTWRALGSALSS